MFGIFGKSARGVPLGLVLSAYGKLPLYKDYIQLACEEEVARTFMHWLDKSFGLTFERYGGKNVLVDHPRRMIVKLDRGRHLVLATIWPSTDGGGLRRFPFAFFTVLDRKTSGVIVANPVQRIREYWPLFEAIWGSFDTQYQEASYLDSIEDFYGIFQEAKIGTRLPSREAAEWPSLEALMEALAQSAAGDGGNPPPDPAVFGGRLTATLSAHVLACKSGAKKGRDVNLRAPLGLNGGVADQAAFWMRALSKHLRGARSWPNLILPAGADVQDPALCLLWRDVCGEDSLLFGGESLEDYERIDDLAAQVRAPDSAAAPIGDPELDLSLELQDWIAALGKKKKLKPKTG